jgi:hypothetical protein
MMMQLPGWFFNQQYIRQRAMDVLREYRRLRGKPAKYPLDPSDIFATIYGLDTIYDHEGVLNEHGEGIIGCLYPDGNDSPWGRDKLIVVNVSRITQSYPSTGTQRTRFNPTVFNERFTVAHEGFGHYVLQFQQGIGDDQPNVPPFCRSHHHSPLERNANLAASEILMPLDEVIYVLDDKQPGDFIEVPEYAARFKHHFAASQAMMEIRLKELGYGMNGDLYGLQEQG